MTFTVGELKEHLRNVPDDYELCFEGGLTFYRTKMRGERLMYIEFNEPQGYMSPSFKRKNPDVKVVFLNGRDFEDGEVIKPIDVSLK